MRLLQSFREERMVAQGGIVAFMEMSSGQKLKIFRRQSQQKLLLDSMRMNMRERFGLSIWKEGVAFDPNRESCRGSSFGKENQAPCFGQEKFEMTMNI